MLKYLLLTSTLALAAVCQDKNSNIVVILTDDQDVVLGGMNPMKNVQRFIGNEGTTFTNSFVTSPICCPSRASFLTGLHVHNHMTLNNSISGGCYGQSWRTLETRTFAASLYNAGYNTFYAGKYLNQYGSPHAGGPETVPPGWSEWHGLVGNSVYYNYTLSNNGVPTYSSDLYLTDIIRDLGLSFIENQTESQPFLMVLAPPAPHQPFTPAPRHEGVFKNVTAVQHPNFNIAVNRDLGLSFIENQTESQPFLMVLAPPAPHQPFTPAPRHEGVFKNVTAVQHPNFNIAVNDKHWLMRMPPSPLPAEMIPELDRVYSSRWESLLAVDEMVADVVKALDSNSLLSNTYLIFTSDNGYHVGQFSQVYDKRQPYEADIRVPLVIRGPKVQKNITNDQPILNIDLAPTIIELAGLSTPKSMDGRPIKFNAQNEELERNMLVEYYGEGKDGTVDQLCPWSYDSDNLAQCYPEYDCKCQDSRNNTYACVRRIARRINKKFCSFADSENFTEMYDLNNDPYELTNIVDQALPSMRHWYQLLLSQLLTCKGYQNCDNPLENLKVYV